MCTPLVSIPQRELERATRLVACDEGQDLVEYALLLVLIVLIAVGAVNLLGGQVVSALYEPVLAAMPS